MWNSVSQEWTWLSGGKTGDNTGRYGALGITSPLNVPGSRSSHSMALDAKMKKVYVFGGYGFAKLAGSMGALNDLWEYDIVTARWVWVSGASAVNQPGTYGQQGVAALGNIPRARDSSDMVFDGRSGALYVFGGIVGTKLYEDPGMC